ncbi:hypothetical protein LXA43DRAFT_330085 [Ganoderma leucocontextum]|nr:hypothetical protein LXA43DRAFT_330085 [Ganoderma leucocontextum]
MPTCSLFVFLKRRTRRLPPRETAEVLGSLDQEGYGVQPPSFHAASLYWSLPLPSSPHSASSAALSSQSSSSESCPSSPALLSPSPDLLLPSPDSEKSSSHEVHAQLPLELWAEVFGYVDERALQVLMLINQTLSREAERFLYRNVLLGSSISLAIFIQSISASPHRAAFVTSIHIPSIEDNDPHASLAAIPSLLRSLDKLKHLTLKLFETRLPRDYLFVLQMILSVRFPSLRSLSLRMPLFLDDSFLVFLQSHPHLNHLDLGEIPPSVQPDYSSFRFTAISSLACTFRLLTSLRPVLPSLTHVHILSCSSGHLLRVAELLGSQIVSLRLGSIYVPIQHVHHERAAMSLHGVAARFPRLRFLQLDMGQEDNRYGRVQAVDYRLKRPAGDDAAGLRHDAARITLVWVFSRPKHEGHGVWVAPGYKRFVNKAALEVLKEWGHYVERVVFAHGTGTYESLRLDEGGSRLVRAEDWAGWEGCWRCA